MSKYPEDFINKIICGDCLEVMKEMPENSVDAIVTDPPYGLEFMGKEWDKLGAKFRNRSKQDEIFKENKHIAGKLHGRNPDKYLAGLEMQLWHTQWLTEAYRVLKPGGSMLVMGGTRTFHRLMVAIEDTGFIIKDTLMWIYGSGFPKAQDLGKMIDKREKVKREKGRFRTDGRGKWETKLNREKGDTGIGHADGSKQQYYETLPATDLAKHWDGFKVGGIKPAYEPIVWAVKPPEGSYIDNVLKWGVGAVNVDECRVGYQNENDEKITDRVGVRSNKNMFKIGNTEYKPDSKGRFPANVILDEEAGRMLDEQSGVLKSGWNDKDKSGPTPFVASKIVGGQHFNDSGGASRFFYCAKASRSERGKNNKHPTVKPISLFMWLIQLITREEQAILDPFLGSGTTMLSAQGCNRKCIGIEKDPDYCKIAEERLAQGVL